MRRLLLAVILGLCVSAPAWALDPDPVQYPWNSLARLQLGARLTYDWFDAPEATIPLAFKKEWNVGLGAAYNIVPKMSAIGRIEYGVDNKLWHYGLGVNVQLYKGKP